MRVTFAGARRPAVRAAATAAGAWAEADAGLDTPPSAAPTTPPSDFAKSLRCSRLACISTPDSESTGTVDRRIIRAPHDHDGDTVAACAMIPPEESSMTRWLMSFVVGVAAAVTSLTGQTQTGAGGRPPARQNTPLVMMSPKAKSAGW